MKHSNISIFIPHIGCPHRCSFCDQRTISGSQHAPSGNEVKEICANALKNSVSPENTEIAFFGGSFTAIPHSYMTELLEAAHPFIGDEKFRGIRVSTRPDCIDREILSLLKDFGVTSIELGAQSMSDRVLEMNGRGHYAEDVIKACELIRGYGFELGLQIMLGLYGSTFDDDYDTIWSVLDIKPDTVRIYPAVILKGTRLAVLYESGEYQTYPFDEVVNLAAMALRWYKDNGIEVIKCGLHASEFVEKDMIGGFYHPAFREICESEIYREEIIGVIRDIRGLLPLRNPARDELFEFAVAPSCISKAIGHKKSNYEFFRENGIELKIVGDESVPEYEVRLRR